MNRCGATAKLSALVRALRRGRIETQGLTNVGRQFARGSLLQEGEGRVVTREARLGANWSGGDQLDRQNAFCSLASARTQETANRNFAVEHREPGVLAGLTDARVQWPAHRHERDLLDRPPTPAR